LDTRSLYAIRFGRWVQNTMTPSDVAFSRVILGSVVAFGLVALAYFRLFGQRAKVAVSRRLSILLPIVGVGSVGASLAFDLPLVAKGLLWFLGASSLFVCLLALIAGRSMRSLLKAKPKT
jgi:hypothetical protein